MTDKVVREWGGQTSAHVLGISLLAPHTHILR